MMSFNLKDVKYPQRMAVSTGIDEMVKYADNYAKKIGEPKTGIEAFFIAYYYSLPLMASAKQGDDTYYKILPKMNQAMANKLLPETMRAWLDGRRVVAARAIGDVKTQNSALAELRTILDNPNLVEDEFSAWAWGYRASLDSKEYADSKEKMIASAMKLHENYTKPKKTEEKASGSSNHQALSDAVYGWLMTMQAAAFAQDKKTYQLCKHQIEALANKTSLADALTSTLDRTEDSSDYPAWGIAIAMVSAEAIDDKPTYQLLQKALGSSIKAANAAAAKAKAEFIKPGTSAELRAKLEKFVFGVTAEVTLSRLDSNLAQHNLEKSINANRFSLALLDKPYRFTQTR